MWSCGWAGRICGQFTIHRNWDLDYSHDQPLRAPVVGARKSVSGIPSTHSAQQRRLEGGLAGICLNPWMPGGVNNREGEGLSGDATRVGKTNHMLAPMESKGNVLCMSHVFIVPQKGPFLLKVPRP